jgi:hypothetical protein
MLPCWLVRAASQERIAGRFCPVRYTKRKLIIGGSSSRHSLGCLRIAWRHLILSF